MTTPRPPAQIHPALLARKGEARPAMRPHGTGPDSVDGDDLGWNDLGDSKPAVLRDRAKLQAVSATPSSAGESIVLDLDPDRMLRLKLAATVRNLTPEAFVRDALDRSLPSASDIAALVQRLDPDGAAKGTS
ncbi:MULTISPECIES: hypothetical protein [unclassified Sphingomonas]|uniref:hypothetical protein n=1 Tax=unclassified Sphingomonas TaxID=196159 RepID=UPI0006F8A0E4|nr:MULTISPECIES: hypothetical protein [unclassified Sphingomonas]KQM66959.1 hypothetical protein ASE65_02550 [Sphingomonas sp. Leaf16]KQN17905.1 hypothetical protein ASE81_01930 [Sphingomonas sp. Leaf29]KQN23769.1 hypothetical protein ASE83_04810 [Sphingomonas sp. Leaf32]